MHEARRSGWLVFLPVTTAAFILLAPVWARGQALFWGTPVMQFVPWRDLGWEMVKAWQPPLWNPYAGLGAPLLANYQSAFFYPPNLVYFLLTAVGGTPAAAWGQALVVAAHLAWSGAGMALVVRRLGVQTLGQVVSGLAFGLSGYLVARAGFLSINATAAWLPWVILFLTPDLRLAPLLEEASTTPVRRAGLLRNLPSFWPAWAARPERFAGLALCLGLQLLAGHAQTAWYTWLLAVFWSGFWGWRMGQREQTAGSTGGRGLLGAWVFLGLAAVGGLALAAVQIFPTAEYVLQSQRSSAVEFELAMTYSFWPWRLLGLAAPDLFGNPARGDYWGYGNYWEDALYVGVLPLLLAVAGWLRRSPPDGLDGADSRAGWRPGDWRGLRWFILLLVAVTLVLALGKNTPVFPWLYRHVPTFSLFQGPARYLIWLTFSLALFAGFGVQGWRRPEGRALYWTRLGTAGAFAITLGAGLALVFLGAVEATFIRATALAGFWFLLAGILALLAPEQIDGRTVAARGWALAVVLAVTFDLLVAGWGLNPGIPRKWYGGQAPTAGQVLEMAQDGRLFLPDSEERKIKFEKFFRFDTFWPAEGWTALRASLLPNIHLLDRVPSANNFDPLVPGRYARWMAFLDRTGWQNMPDWLNLMAVSVVELEVDNEPNGIVFVPAGPERLPARARWLPCARPVEDGEQAWESLTGGDVDWDTEVVLETSEVRTCDPAASGNVVWLQTDSTTNPHTLILQVEASSSGWLLLSDVWYPGWQAFVDGEATDVRRANYLFRAVPVEAGQHRVEFIYRPVSFWSGLGISLPAWIVLLYLRVKYRPGLGGKRGDRLAQT